MKTGSTSYMRESFVEGLLRRTSLPQSKVSASIEGAVLVHIRSMYIQYKKRTRNVGRGDFLLNYNIGCKKHTTDRALIALRGLLALLQERFMRKWWHWSKVTAWNFTIKTFETCQFNESRRFICRNAIVQEKTPETCTFHGWCFKLGWCFPLLKFLAMRLVATASIYQKIL